MNLLQAFKQVFHRFSYIFLHKRQDEVVSVVLWRCEIVSIDCSARGARELRAVPRLRIKAAAFLVRREETPRFGFRFRLIWLKHSYHFVSNCAHGILYESNTMRSRATRRFQQSSLETHEDDIGFDTLADGATVVSVGFRQWF